MVQLSGALKGPLFGIDSKMHYKEWFNYKQEKKQLRLLFGVSVNALQNENFEPIYESLIDQLFKKYGLAKGRMVYASSEIGTLLSPDREKYRNFCMDFTDEILRLDDVNITYFVTRINEKKLLGDNKITIYGNYGTATRKASVGEFIDKIAPYYNLVCAWKLSKVTGVNKGMFLFDGTEAISPCRAWDEFSTSQYLRIIYHGDKVIPVISTADILLRCLDFCLEGRTFIIDENSIRKLVIEEGGASEKNKFFTYIGNPDLQSIKPMSESALTLNDLSKFIHHPVVFVSAGDIPGQSSMLEASPKMERVYDLAASLNAGVRFYHPKKDRYIIGANPEATDYFVPFNDIAKAQLQALQYANLNVKELGL